MPFLLKLWYSCKISSALKKYRAGVVVASDVSYLLSIKIPQLLIISDPCCGYQQEAILKGSAKFSNKYVSKRMQKAKAIAALSRFVKSDIIENYTIEPSRIDVIYTGVNEIYVPLDLAEKQKIREEYSGGNEYFLFPAHIYNEEILLNLLKAFAVFKKWQKSSMQLIILPGIASANKKYAGQLRLFKYRGDVKVLENLPAGREAKITAAAYVMIYPFLINGFTMPPLQAMRCNTPVIAGNSGIMNEICGDAALYVDPLNHDDIAGKMMAIFKDENLKTGLTKKGSEQVKKYSWENTGRLLWQSILNASA